MDWSKRPGEGGLDSATLFKSYRPEGKLAFHCCTFKRAKLYGVDSFDSIVSNKVEAARRNYVRLVPLRVPGEADPLRWNIGALVANDFPVHDDMAIVELDSVTG